MFSEQEIVALHTKLAQNYPECRVLLGGSYLYGEAREDSDLDFYVIGSIYQCLKIILNKEKLLGLKSGDSRVTVMVVPNLFYSQGWYYVYGRDVAGKIWKSVVNKKIVFRNCLKLAYYHYLRFVAGAELTSVKTINQLRVAKAIASNEFDENLPLFSPENYKINLSDNIEAELLSLRQAGSRFLSFSLINYLIYNLRFIPKGNFRFIFCNPDKCILDKMQRAFVDRTKVDFSSEVFPVYIV